MSHFPRRIPVSTSHRRLDLLKRAAQLDDLLSAMEVPLKHLILNEHDVIMAFSMINLMVQIGRFPLALTLLELVRMYYTNSYPHDAHDEDWLEFINEAIRVLGSRGENFK
jgi:hypothetical protein